MAYHFLAADHREGKRARLLNPALPACGHERGEAGPRIRESRLSVRVLVVFRWIILWAGPPDLLFAVFNVGNLTIQDLNGREEAYYLRGWFRCLRAWF